MREEVALKINLPESRVQVSQQKTDNSDKNVLVCLNMIEPFCSYMGELLLCIFNKLSSVF